MSSTSAANLFGVNGLVAVITGGGTGIGLMMAQALEENGAKVYIVGRRLEVLEKAAKTAKNGNIIPVKGDVTKKEDLQTIVDQITKDDGFINVLVANSGIGGPGFDTLTPTLSITEFRDALWKIDFEGFTNTHAVNNTAVFFTIAAFLGLLDAGNKKGNIEQASQVIATSSVGGFSRVAWTGFAYGPSKAAVTHMMKQFATQMVPYNIRSNIIAPGFYHSELASGAINRFTQADGTIPTNVIPLKRPGTIEDMAGAILYLTSRAGAYLNGSVIVTDGGRLSIMPSTY